MHIFNTWPEWINNYQTSTDSETNFVILLDENDNMLISGLVGTKSFIWLTFASAYILWGEVYWTLAMFRFYFDLNVSLRSIKSESLLV